MSGDVQPRRRKDRKKKRDDEDLKEHHHGVHTTKMGTDDVHIHIHSEHGTGGHWCAKIFFFSLLTILVGLIGLIIIENRGLVDSDTPLSESRFSNYFDGWVEEHTESHDDHDVVAALIEKHEHDDEPFEEEEDEASETEEEVNESHAEENDADAELESEENRVLNESQEKENERGESTIEDESKELENHEEIDLIEDIENDEEEDIENDEEKDIENVEEEDIEDDDERDDEIVVDFNKNQASQQIHKKYVYTDENDDVEDDVGTEESLENIVDNDAEELLLLQGRAQKHNAAGGNNALPTEEESESVFSNSLAVKIGVGMALAFVARLVLIKKNPNTKIEYEEIEYIQEEVEEEVEEEEEEIEEEIEVEEEEEEVNIKDVNKNKCSPSNCVPRYKDERSEETLPIPAADYKSEIKNPKNNNFHINQNVSDKDEVITQEEGEEGEEEEQEYEIESNEDEDFSDIDDDDLMSRLETKYGKLASTEYESDDSKADLLWTKINAKSAGGPQSRHSDEFFEEELRKANEELLQEKFYSALAVYAPLSQKYPDKAEVFLGQAKCLDSLSEKHRSNTFLMEALYAYKRYLAFGDKISNIHNFKEAAERCIDRMRFSGYYKQAIPIHELLISRFSNDSVYQNQLTVTYLLANSLSDAKKVLQETLERWPNDSFAMAYYGYVLISLNENLNAAVEYLQKGIDSEASGTQDGRLFLSLGDTLQRIGRTQDAFEVFKRGANLNIFPSLFQRSIYNVPGLKAQSFWTKEETTYQHFFEVLEINWLQIRDEGLNILTRSGYFLNEVENLKHFGNWKQFVLFSRGQRNEVNCLKAPLTCRIIETFPAARSCKRGQIKFSVMHSGTHVWPHCGPTNCRLRGHLGLKIPPNTFLRVAKEIRNWTEGKFLIFDDSFEHEVWHNGTDIRLVLIVDVWHPELTKKRWKSLTPI